MNKPTPKLDRRKTLAEYYDQGGNCESDILEHYRWMSNLEEVTFAPEFEGLCEYILYLERKYVWCNKGESK